MKPLCIFLFCLLTTQAAIMRKSKRGHRYSVREVGHHNGGGGGGGGEGGQQGGGYQYHASSAGGGSHMEAGPGQEQNYYQTPASGGGVGAGAGHNAGGGGDAYQYQAPADGGGTMAALMMAHHEAMNNFHAGGSNAGVVAGSGVGGAAPAGGGGDGGYHYEEPITPASAPSGASSSAPAGFADLQSFHAQASAAVGGNGDGGHSFGNAASSYTSGGPSGGKPYDFNAVLNSVNSFSSGGFGGHGIGGSSGSSDQFQGVEGEVIDENPPSIFKYKPRFGGKDINKLPHILPPGGKNIHELQEEADAKLRAIIAKAKMNQMEVVERIAKLRTNYGYGTFGFDGFKETRFEKMGKIDLGTHKAIDLGTSIDYNALKGSDGKLKLPVQNVYHTKTLGIHIPEPYPVKHEVAVPAPFPVPHPIPVPHNKPTPFSPLNHEDIAHLTADDGRGSYGLGFGGNNGGGEAFTGHNFGGGGSGGHSFGGQSFGGQSFGGQSFGGQSFGGSHRFVGNGGGSTFKGVSTGTFSIEPSQSISESSTIGGLPYGAGTPNAGGSSGEGGDVGHVDLTMEQQVGAVGMFGLPAGASSGALTSYQGPAQDPQQDFGTPHVEHGQAISSEAGTVEIPAMNFGSGGHQDIRQDGGARPHPEYGPPH